MCFLSHDPPFTDPTALDDILLSWFSGIDNNEAQYGSSAD